MMLATLTLVGALATGGQPSVAGRHCVDSNLSILTAFPVQMQAPMKLETPGPDNVIVRIDTVAARERDFPKIAPILGYIYVLGNGDLYYNPRSQAVLSERDIEASKAFMLAAGALRSATPGALNWALKSYGTASVRIYPTAQSFKTAKVTRRSCLVWPKGQPLPK